MIVVEDAQWVDEASAELLERLVGAAAWRAWLVLVVRRPGEGGFAPTGVESLVIGPLGREEAEHLVWTATDAAPMRPHEVDAIVSRAAGNPLFLQEMLRIVQQDGVTASLPESLHAVIDREIDALEPAMIGVSSAVRRCSDGASSSKRSVSSSPTMSPTASDRWR